MREFLGGFVTLSLYTKGNAHPLITQELAGEGGPAGLGGAEGVPWCGAGSPYSAMLLGPCGAPCLEPC